MDNNSDNINNELFQHEIDIELIKQNIVYIEKDVNELKTDKKKNNNLLITSLISTILCLIGVIFVVIQLYFEK